MKEHEIKPMKIVFSFKSETFTLQNMPTIRYNEYECIQCKYMYISIYCALHYTCTCVYMYCTFSHKDCFIKIIFSKLILIVHVVAVLTNYR